MLGKILLTLAVIAGAFFVIRQRQIAEAEEDRNPNEKSAPSPKSIPAGDPHSASADDTLAADLRIGAYLFLVLTVGLGATLYYFRWQDDHTVLSVYLHRDNQSEPVTYQVYKYQLQDRSFITIDGTTVTVASSERMEVIGLE